MRIVKATRQDWIWPGIFLLLGLAGTIVSLLFYTRAFPEAALDLQVTREDAMQRATAWLRLRGLNPDPFRASVVFDTDSVAKTYLERELPTDEASRLMGTGLGVWSWTVRRTKPPDKEELVVALDPRQGDLVRFDHIISDDAPGATLGREEARRLAEIFLRAQKGVTLDHYTLIKHELKTQSHRADHVFAWERKDFKIKEATYRLFVNVQGDQVGHFSEMLKVPEQWLRDYDRMRSTNDLFGSAAEVFYVPLIIAALVVLVQRTRRKQIAWKTVVILAGAVGLLQAIDLTNRFPLMVANMPTTFSMSAMIALAVVVAVVIALFATLWVGLTAAAGGPLYAEMLPGRLSLSRLFSISGLRTREFFFSTITGYGMAGFHIGATVVFYLLARRFGAWSPLDVSYSNALSTPLPWVAPLAASLLASTSEEFSFRFFAIPLLHRWLRSRWLAIIIPALIWGFMHSSYPQQPAWIRGVEVGAIGVLAGWVMLRFGILATLVWHYTVDAMLIGLFLIRSDHLFYRLSGVLVADVVLIPLVVCVVLYFQQGGFVESADEEADRAGDARAAIEPTRVTPTADMPAAAAPAPSGVTSDLAPPSPAYAPIPWPRLRMAVIIAVAAIVVLTPVDMPWLGSFVRFTATRSQMEEAARQALVKRGVDVASFRMTSQLVTNLSPAVEYLRRKVGVGETNRLYESGRVRPVEWETRFFRPLGKEEYRVRTAPDGTDPRVTYIQDENAPGARLTIDVARAKVEAFLAGRGITLAEFTAVESNLDARAARDDYRFVWEARRAVAGDAHERITVRLIGDVISGPEHTIKVPEAWQREFEAIPLRPMFMVVGLIGLCCLVLVLFFKRLGQRESRNRVYVVFAVAAALAVSINYALDWPAWAAEYNTAVSWGNAVALNVGTILLVGMGTLAVGLLALIADTLLARDFGLAPFLPAPTAGRAVYLRDALVGGGAAGVLVLGINGLAGVPAVMLPPQPIPSPGAVIGVGVSLSSLWPSGSELLGTGLVALIALPVLGIAVALVADAWRRWGGAWTGAVLLFGALGISAASAQTLMGFALTGISAIVLFSSIGAMVWFLRRNATGYLVAIGVMMAMPVAKQLARQPAYRTDTIVYVAVLVAVGLALAAWWRREARKEDRAGDPQDAR
jgi:membrane protease YdiL (CAAX protease family)